MADLRDPVDVHVGNAIRTVRKGLGLSQVALAERIGLTFQQVQKYERGSNRVSASKLAHIADALGGSPADFFPPTLDPAEAELGAVAGPVNRLGAQIGGLELAICFLNLEPKGRAALVRVAQAMCDREGDQPGRSYVDADAGEAGRHAG